ncbi:pirin family protein, partial [Arthrospira platensis SPKY2]
GSVIRPGEVQRMTAGTGIYHSEFNGSETQPVHLLQIWIIPNENGLPPSYEQKAFSEAEQWGQLQLLGSPDGRNGSVTIHQDVELYGAKLTTEDDQINYTIKPGRVAWIQIARGSVVLGDRTLSQGDGVAITPAADETHIIRLTGTSDPAEILLFDLAVPSDYTN